jgi:hypothetical protein
MEKKLRCYWRVLNAREGIVLLTFKRMMAMGL